MIKNNIFRCSGWEGGEFEIRFNKKTCIHVNIDISDEADYVCKHCIPAPNEITTRHDGSTFTSAHVIIPRIVIAWNEGGCCTTGVCLDCLLEAVETLKPTSFNRE